MVAAAACAVALTAGPPQAGAAPAFDSQGYLDSTARCVSDAVVFGSTNASRIAICESSSGGLQYRGVRVRDGARLITTATRSGDGAFVADNDGVTYTVSAKSLVVSAGSRVVRTETMVDFHGSTASAESTDTTSEPAPTETTPVPSGPPLPAEVGGSGS
ncbi:MAG: hypothetical protein ABWY45_11015 [Mycobacterium sp.]